MMIYLLKSGLCMGILLLFYHLILEKESMYRFNRFYLLGAIFFSLLVPFMISPMNWQFVNEPIEINRVDLDFVGAEVILPYENTSQFLSTQPMVKEPKPRIVINLIFIIYSVITLIFVVRLIAQLMSFRRLTHLHSIIHKDDIHIVLLEKNTLPFTFFNYLFVSADRYHAKDIEPEIWEHELAHIKEKHSYDILLIEVIKVIFWFNPLLYFYKNAIQLNHEFLADRAVTALFNDIHQYQILLINKSAENQNVFRLSSSFNYTTTKKRLTMMYRQTSLGKSILVKILLLPIIYIMTGLLGSAAHQTSDPFSNPSLPDNGSLTTQYEYYINEAINVQKPNILLLAKLDIEGIKRVYQQMSQHEREQVSNFPFLEDQETVERLKLLQGLPNPHQVEFVFSSPPAKKSISTDVWTAWMETSTLELEIDGIPYPREKLSEYSPTDFSLYNAREEHRPIKGAVFQVTLFTHDYYYHQYVKVIKKVIGIRASYIEDSQLDVPLGIISTRNSIYTFKNSIPANLALSILDELIDPGKKRKSFINLNEDQGFPIHVIQGNETKTQYVITN